MSGKLFVSSRGDVGTTEREVSLQVSSCKACMPYVVVARLMVGVVLVVGGSVRGELRPNLSFEQNLGVYRGVMAKGRRFCNPLEQMRRI